MEMKDMEIIGTNRWEIRVIIGDRSLIITGELTFTPPVFYANIASIKHWEYPYERVEITEQEKKEIIDSIEKRNNGVKFLFD